MQTVSRLTGDGSEIPTIVEMWRAIVHRKLVVLAIVVPIVSLAAIVAYLAPPSYRATATLLIEQSASRVVSIEQVYAGATSNREYFMSQAEFLRSNDVARRTIRALAFKDSTDFAPRGLFDSLSTAPRESKDGDSVDAADRQQNEVAKIAAFQRHLRIEPIRQSQLIEVSFDSYDPALAAKVANAVAQEYVQADMDAKYSMTQQANVWLNRRLGELRTKLDASERELQAYRELQGLIDSKGSAHGGIGRELEELSQRLVEARVRRTQAEQVYNQVRLDAPGRYNVPAVLSSPAVVRARQIEADAERLLNDAAQRYGANFPIYKTAETELARAKANSKKEADSVIAGIVKEYEAARSTELSLERTLARSRGAVQELNRKEIGLASLEREAATNRQVYQTFLDRVRQTAAAADIQIAAARVIDPALPPNAQVAPRRTLIVASAFVVSLMLGCLVALLAKRLENTINSADSIQEITGLPLLSTVPELKIGKRKSPVDYMIENPSSLFTDSIRLALTGIQLMHPELNTRVIGIVSSIQGEGKSTVALSLAVVCARNRRTLVIDADLRRPTLGRAIGISKDQPGLAELSVGTASLENCIIPVPNQRFWILPSGSIAPDASLDVINSAKFRSLLEKLKTQFDEIIIDCPPLNPVADGLMIGRLCDGVALVVRAHSTPLPVVNASLSKLGQSGVATFGLILNRYDSRVAQQFYGAAAGYGQYEYAAKG
jgi:succinoglycan biosynthesis transport protein ExoP